MHALFGHLSITAITLKHQWTEKITCQVVSMVDIYWALGQKHYLFQGICGFTEIPVICYSADLV